MDILNSYSFIIIATLVIILSYFFNQVAKRTNIPAVLLLILTGILLKYLMDLFHIPDFNFFPILEVLGIVGLIMIVLEASLELNLKKEKLPIIWKALTIAAVGLVATSFSSAFVINFFIDSMDIWTALLYAIPLSILSSAIIIPSVGNLIQAKKEFHVYESTFSDILGIILFYLVLGHVQSDGAGNVVVDFFGNTALTIVIAVVASYALILLFQKIRTPVKLFLLLAILLLIYAIAKLMHLSPLIIILVFGVIMANEQIFFRGFIKRWLDKSALEEIRSEFHLVTIESAFVIRTFFFVVFGITISLASLVNLEVVAMSLCLLVLAFLLRFLLLRIFWGKDIHPQLLTAPRGLITVLLFFAIPEDVASAEFDQGVLLFVIIATSLLMTFALIRAGKRVEPVELDDKGLEEPSPEEKVPNQVLLPNQQSGDHPANREGL